MLHCVSLQEHGRNGIALEARVVLRSEGLKPRAMGYFYKAIVQAILLYGSEIWVVSADYHLRKLDADGGGCCLDMADICIRAFGDDGARSRISDDRNV